MRRIFSRGSNIVWSSQKHCRRLQQLLCHAVIEDWMIPFAAYTAAETPSFSVGRITPKIKIVHSRGGFWPPPNAWFHRPTRVRPQNGISIGSDVLAQLARMPKRQTDRQITLRATSDAIGRICAMHAVRSKNWTKNRQYCLSLADII